MLHGRDLLGEHSFANAAREIKGWENGPWSHRRKTVLGKGRAPVRCRKEREGVGRGAYPQPHPPLPQPQPPEASSSCGSTVLRPSLGAVILKPVASKL